GGHLAALLATDESYLKAHKLTLKNIKGVVALSGVYSIVPAGALAKAFGSDAETCRQASPLSHVRGNHPPFLLAYADRDYPTLGQLAQRMSAMLVKAKSEATCIEIKDRTHVSIMVQVANEADPTTQAMLGFVARHAGLTLVPRAGK